MSYAPANDYVARDARAARKRRAAADTDDGVLGGGDANPRPKRLRTSVAVKTEMPDAMLVGAPAASGDGLPATRTPATARAGITATPSAAGCEWSATPLDFDAPAPVAGLPLESEAFATPLNFDWAPTATATAATMPMELHAGCDARAGPLDARDDANVDPMLVAAYEANRSHVLLDEKRRFNSLWDTPPECSLPATLELPGTDGPVLRLCGMPAEVDAKIAPVNIQAREPEDWKRYVPLDLVSGHALDGQEAPVSAPLDLGMRVAAHVLEDDLVHIDPALWDEDCKPYADGGAAPRDVDLPAPSALAPHAGHVAQLLAPGHADAPEDERTPYVPFNEKLSYITEWRRRVALDVPAPAPSELPASLEPVATILGAYYRPGSVGIPVGDPRTRDWVPLLPPGDGMPPMSPKTKRELEEFLAAYDVGPAFPRARVEMGLLTPDEEPGPAMDLALLDALLFDLQTH